MPKLLHGVVLSAALVASGLALAQTTPPQQGTTQGAKPGTGAAMEPQFRSPQDEAFRASKLIGSSVQNRAGETIGEIDEIVLGKDGKVAAVVIGVGGFLGLGERQVGVSFESLQLRPSADGGEMTPTLEATKETLKAAPEWKPD